MAAAAAAANANQYALGRSRSNSNSVVVRIGVSDVAYIADPNTGVAVYESIPGDGEQPGWQVWGGTSVGSPAIAAIYALSGDTKGFPATNAYANPGDLFDVTSGSNGTSSPVYLCTGEVGYDGPTGLGTPNGLGAF